MPRMPSIVIKDDPAVYHVMSRVALDGYPLGDVEKEYLLETIRHLSSVYFAEVLGFCLMGNHILARMHPEREFSDDDAMRIFKVYYFFSWILGYRNLAYLERQPDWPAIAVLYMKREDCFLSPEAK